MKTVDTDLVEIKGDELFGAKEFLAQLQVIKAFDVSTNTELAQAKKQRAVVAKVKPFIKKLHKQYQEEKEAEFREHNPEFALIEALTNDLLADFDNEIKPYVASIKGQRLERIQPMIDEISGNYHLDPYPAPAEYANEEIEQGELDVREIEAGRYIKPHEFERYIKDNSRLVNTEEINHE